MKKLIVAAGILGAAGLAGISQMEVTATEQTPEALAQTDNTSVTVETAEQENAGLAAATGNLAEGNTESLAEAAADDAATEKTEEKVEPEKPAITNGWNENKTMYYFNGIHMTGQQNIDGYWYLFDVNGNKQTGFQDLDENLNKEGDKTCYYNLDTGQMMYGQQQIQNKWYCFDLFTGKMFTGETHLSSAYEKSGPKTVFYNANGQMQYGIINDKYYAEGTGALQANKLVTWQGNKYYVKGNGTIHKGELNLNGKWKYFDEEGKMKTSFVTLEQNKNGFKDKTKTVYYNSNGDMLYGQQNINGKWYCFHNTTGKMFTGLTPLSIAYERNGAKTVLYAEDGHMLYNEQFHDGKKIWLDSVTGAMLKNGFHGNKYYDNTGHMVTGEKFINGKWKYFDENGIMKTGFVFLEQGINGVKDPDKTVYYDDKGNMLYGQQNIKGSWYCFDKKTGEMFRGEHYLDKSYEPSGAKTVRYYNGGKKDGQMVYGVYTEGSKVFSYHERTGAKQSYALRTETIGEKSGTIYYNASGNKEAGQKNINGKWYFFDPENEGFMATGLTVLKKEYEKAGEKTVFYNNDGTMYYGQKQLKDGWKYFKPGTGAMARNELVAIPKQYEPMGAKTCYYDAEGNMVYGPQVINGVKMEFDKVTGALIGDTKKLADELAAYINANKLTGEVWCVAVSLLNGTQPGIYNNQSQQSASLMKLFVMGAVYDNYDWMCNSYGKSRVDGHLWNMITVSDNNAWKTLVTWLGGSYEKGTAVVTQWSHDHGYNDTRTINQAYGNWTSVKDTMNIVKDIANGRFKHSGSMQNLLNNQKRKNKLPAGLPAGVASGNKTGELADTENDVAIVYAPKGTYVISVMSTALKGAGHAQGMIKEISRLAYNFLNA